MQRREFLTWSARAAAAGSAVSVSGHGAGAQGPVSVAADETPRLWGYTHEEHRRRLENIARCTRGIRSCMRKHLIGEYHPGQACYNLGEYPAREPWFVDEYDEQELDRLRDHGIRVVQVFDDWNDSLRLFGGDKYSAVNPEGYRRFIEMAHRRGIKVLTYTSPCFIERSHPEFRQEWSREGDYLIVGYWDMARCSPASPGWRGFLLPRLARIMDEYGADGLYVDGGYLANQHAAKGAMPLADDEIPAFEETPEHDGAFADLLAIMYNEVKRRGGILKLHVNGAEQPQAGGLRTYDYLWVGEGVGQADALREAVKDYAPYLVPCIDTSFAALETEDEPYLHSIPYMQFPVMHAGRIFTGERGSIPGVHYNDDFWTRRCRETWARYQADPSSIHVYSGWDAVPGNPEARPTHARWLRRYLPLVEEGTWAWLEVGASTLFAAPLPEDVVVSAFANRDLWLVVANYGRAAVEIETTETYAAVDTPSAAPQSRWTLPARTLTILRRTV